MASNQTFTLNIKALFDASDVKAKVGEIQNAFKNIKLPDDLARSLDKSFVNVNKALDDFNSKVNKGVKSKADATGITKSFDTVTKELENLDKLMAKVKNELGSGVDLSQIIRVDGSVKDKLNQLKQEIADLQKQVSQITSGKLDELQNKLSLIKSGTAASNKGKDALKLFSEGDIQGAINLLDQVIQKQQQLKAALTTQGKNTTNIDNSITQLEAMKKTMEGVLPSVETFNQQIGSKAAEAAKILGDAQQQTAQKARDLADGLHQTALGAQGASSGIHELTANQAQFNKEIDQVKSRIQYFFGLNNAINLVKRAIRGAVETIKELDKAMTETAVVTNYTIKDMWAQLPEYTKRANELGVTTKDAYQAATLYFQQGLNAEQAAALSTETLKMARIAGLEAAEATDRMTNALRGFNMELDALNAQRVDDVYSQLAAMSASNVDEISTAMTKVASLAHNANMEFETTAAFLAQIIETTRESAETAGTALKTVIARFSEVKKLYSEDQLKGTDEEGQGIDVNKISAALRTAGIDLNKYFLGEVGLDDIFMELASKWDTLTSVQQRYIATQAAGSRQQSRFIALMQDYKRTTELVTAAQNANGASAKQFGKTQDSLQSKLARLKNAWNEFLMGLANNTVVKGAVDLLTTLLNVVNKLTSAFGNGVGSLLKWITVAAAFFAVKSAFAPTGLITRGLTALTAGTGIGTALTKAGILGAAGGAGGAAAGAAGAAGAASKGGFPLIIGGIGNLGKKALAAATPLGRKVMSSPGVMGDITTGLGAKLGLSSGTAAGLTGIATSIAALTAAVAAAYGIYKLWEHTAPEGKLKLAKREAENANKESEKAQKELKSLTSLQDTYKEKTEAVTKALNAQDYNKAIEERNQAILNAISEDNTLAQYVVTQQIDDQIVLTIDEEAFKTALENAAESAKNAEIKEGFANASISIAEADVTKAALRDLFRGTKLYSDSRRSQAEESLTPEQMRDAIINSPGARPEDIVKANQLYAQYVGQMATASQQAQLSYSKSLQDLHVSDEIANALLPILGDAFEKTGKQLDITELRNLTQTDNSFLKAVSEAYAGKGKMAEIALNNANIDIDSDKFFTETLGLSEEALNRFAAALKMDVNELKSHIRAQAKANKEVQRAQQANVFKKTLESGNVIDIDLFKQIKSLPLQMTEQISSIADQAQKFMSTEGFKELMGQMVTGGLSSKQLTEIQEFYNNFNLDNPIQAFHQLKQAQDSVSKTSPFGKMLDDLEKANKAIFSASNLVQSFFTSESYDKLSDSIDDLIEKNGKIDAKNIKDLASSCKDLDTMLQDNIVSAQGLAEAINLLEDGTIAIDDITNSLLAALSAGESFSTLISNVEEWIEGFDPGKDLTEGTEHMISVVDDAMKYVESWQFGNTPLESAYDHLFGEGEYAKFMERAKKAGKTYEQIASELTSQFDHIKALAENQGLGALQEAYQNGLTGLQQNDAEGLDWTWDLSKYKTAEEAIKDVARALNTTDEMARAYIESWASHLYGLGKAWDSLNFTDAMRAFNKELGDSKVVTEQQLEALAKETGKSVGEILNEINKLRDEAGQDIIFTVNWKNEKGQNLSGPELIQELGKAAGWSRTDSYSASGELTDSHGSQQDYEAITKGYIHAVEAVPIGETVAKKFNAIDFSEFSQHLAEAYNMPIEQAEEATEHIASQLDTKLSKTISVPVKLDDGSIGSTEKTIIADTVQGLEAGINAELEKANFQLLADGLADLDVSSLGNNLYDSLLKALPAVGEIKTAIESLPSEHEVRVTYVEINRPARLASGAIITVSTGGQIESYAKGSENFHVKAGTALTGEEGPELVWNKNNRYAYLTGEKGPEFQDLKPGDRIFNAEETKRILKNSMANGGKIGAYAGGSASGGWNPEVVNGGGGKGGSGGGGGKEGNPTEWENELDWLYNLMEDIAELQRVQTKLAEKHDRYLEDISKTGRDLYNVTRQQLNNLYTERDNQREALIRRRQEMDEQIGITGLGNYVWWNDKDSTIEIDWDAIEAIQDKDTYDEVKELIDRVEKIQDEMDTAQDALWDIEGKIKELEDRYLQEFTDFQQRIMDAVVNMYQESIDNLTELNDTLNDTNTQILDSLQKEIDYSRQIRDNTETERDIADMEARLAYLHRDTTGGNAQEIRELEKQLEDARQNYEDTLIDQSLQRLQESNEQATEQRQQQIDLLTAQLEYWQETGALWDEVAQLMQDGISADGTLVRGSQLEQVLANAEGWKGMSEAQREVWANDLITATNQAAAYLIKISEGLGGISAGVWAMIPNSSVTSEKLQYATGGLNNKTGWAWLDGTASEPEYVLNARQTDAFLKLADVLPSMMTSGGGITNNMGGNVYAEFSVNVGSISNDYDVDRMMDRIKTNLYDASTYRNSTAISRIR